MRRRGEGRRGKGVREDEEREGGRQGVGGVEGKMEGEVGWRGRVWKEDDGGWGG